MTQLLPLETWRTWVPRRFVQTQPPQYLSWTFRQRKVFALVNGKRDVATIARLLSISSYAVTNTLRELQLMHMIVREEKP